MSFPKPSPVSSNAFAKAPGIATPISVGPAIFTADPAGALWEASRRTLIISDLHFEKGSSYAERGVFLPPYDTRATLAVIAALVARYRPERVISLGDAFHDPDAEARMNAEDAATLARLCEATEWIWILGNHDPLPPQRFRGAVHSRLEIGGVLYVHEPSSGAETPEIAGHLHPVARVRGAGRRKCFATDGRRLVMPSLGAYTGGLNVRDEAFAPLFPRNLIAYVVGQSQVHPLPRRALMPDPPTLPR